MHCDKCSTVITKAVMIVEIEGRNYGMDEEEIQKHYCKKCFIREFMNE